MNRSDHWSFQNVCTCSCVWKPAKGTYEYGTNRWLPDVPTVHVRMVVDDACPIHGETNEPGTSP